MLVAGVAEETVALRFGAFTLDRRTRQVMRGTRPLHLPPKAFDLLVMLIEQRPAAVAKADIHLQLWPDSFVSDGNVAVLVADIRDALGDSAQQPEFVRTIHRFGYAFIASAAEVDSPAVRRPPAACWLAHGTERAHLVAGENVVGREPAANIRVGLDPAADLRTDPAGVSRRHAKIVVADDVATLHDLSSKNGTFVDGVRVTSPVALTDGSQVRLGSLSLQFGRWNDLSATRTLGPSADTPPPGEVLPDRVRR